MMYIILTNRHFFAPLWNVSVWEDDFTEYSCTAWWRQAGMTCGHAPPCHETEQPSYNLMRRIQEILSLTLQVGRNESQAVSSCGVRKNLSKLITASYFLFQVHHRNATRGVALQFKQQLRRFTNERHARDRVRLLHCLCRMVQHMHAHPMERCTC